MKYINPSRFVLSVLFFSVVLSSIMAFADNSKTNISDNVLRLHVIANSNSPEDQSLKLKVRDRIISDANTLLVKAENKEDALLSAKKNLSFLESSVHDELRKNGSTYDARVEIGSFDFPPKKYGKILLPAGNYNAVRVVIGDGTGKNWWCVMFPPLCFTNGTVELSEDCTAYLKSHLSKGEYSLITESAPDIELRFKTLDILKNLFE